MGTEGTLATSSAGALVAAAMTSVPSAASFSSIITIELDRTNFSLWRAQVVPAMSRASLFGHLDGTIRAPPKMVAEGEGKE
jgi:hypothetical protein